MQKKKKLENVGKQVTEISGSYSQIKHTGYVDQKNLLVAAHVLILLRTSKHMMTSEIYFLKKSYHK
jgi:hypothetical protein